MQSKAQADKQAYSLAGCLLGISTVPSALLHPLKGCSSKGRQLGCHPPAAAHCQVPCMEGRLLTEPWKESTELTTQGEPESAGLGVMWNTSPSGNTSYCSIASLEPLLEQLLQEPEQEEGTCSPAPLQGTKSLLPGSAVLHTVLVLKGSFLGWRKEPRCQRTEYD